MWILSNETPFAAKEGWTRDERGHEVWLVAIKASFEIDPAGKQRLLKDQTPVNMAPVFGSDPNELLDETDFNLEKKHTDILIEGHVHAPGGRPAVESVARIKDGFSGNQIIPARVSADEPARTVHENAYRLAPNVWWLGFGGIEAGLGPAQSGGHRICS